jgi:hypothetical protein
MRTLARVAPVLFLGPILSCGTADAFSSESDMYRADDCPRVEEALQIVHFVLGQSLGTADAEPKVHVLFSGSNERHSLQSAASVISTSGDFFTCRGVFTNEVMEIHCSALHGQAASAHEEMYRRAPHALLDSAILRHDRAIVQLGGQATSAYVHPRSVDVFSRIFAIENDYLLMARPPTWRERRRGALWVLEASGARGVYILDDSS